MNERRALIVASARSWIGTPYCHQQSLKHTGCDCLGLVRGVWREIFGCEPESPPAYSSDWSEAGREEQLLNAASNHMDRVPLTEMLPGDVILFRWRPHLPAKHCGIATEPDRMVHAYQAAGRVAEGHLAAEWRKRIAGVFAFPEARVRGKT